MTIDKYVSISIVETGALKVQTEACIQVNVKPNVMYFIANLI